MDMRMRRRTVMSLGAGLVVALAAGGAASVAAEATAITTKQVPANPAGVHGTVTAVNGNTVTITGKLLMPVEIINGTPVATTPPSTDTTITVTLTSNTKYRTDASASLSDVKTGDLVFVSGNKTGDTSYAAQSLSDMGAAPEKLSMRAVGAADGTAVRIQVGPNGPLGTLPAGVVVGTAPAGVSGDVGYFAINGTAVAGKGTFPAPPDGKMGQTIAIFDGGTGDGKPVAAGKVTNISGGTLTLQGPDGTTLTVTTDSKTTVRVRRDGSASGIVAGDTISAGGSKTGDNAITADFVEYHTGQ